MRGWNSSERLSTLVESGIVEIVELDDSSQECFESLVIGPAVDTLDDGEAATIAYARATGTVALIDERKAGGFVPRTSRNSRSIPRLIS